MQRPLGPRVGARSCFPVPLWKSVMGTGLSLKEEHAKSSLEMLLYNDLLLEKTGEEDFKEN